jgi:soluble lytic murein transglycosylase-like protein
MTKKTLVLSLVGLVGALVLMLRQYSTLDKDAIEKLAKEVIEENPVFRNVDYRMIVTMAKIESNFNGVAFRYEPHKNDASLGLMQTLLGTAQWLARYMGYTKYGIPTLKDLADPKISIYFGCAMVRWLSNYRGVSRSEEWIVESYNGGPNNSNSMTQNHLRKYKQAKQEMY